MKEKKLTITSKNISHKQWSNLILDLNLIKKSWAPYATINIHAPGIKKVKEEDIKGKDVHHKDNDPLNNDHNNLSVVTQHYNRREPRLREKEE